MPGTNKLAKNTLLFTLGGLLCIIVLFLFAPFIGKITVINGVELLQVGMMFSLQAKEVSQTLARVLENLGDQIIVANSFIAIVLCLRHFLNEYKSL